jgi:single-strand DNA-binding protein
MSAAKLRQIGHLASAPEMTMVGEGEKRKARVRMTVISNRYFKDDAGDRREVPTSIQWTVWGKQAEDAVEYLGKGSHVAIEGRVDNNNYPDKDNGGEMVYGFSFTCDEIEYLDSKAEAEARRTRAAEGAPA